jgi:FkbM family methyltransferase
MIVHRITRFFVWISGVTIYIEETTKKKGMLLKHSIKKIMRRLTGKIGIEVIPKSKLKDLQLVRRMQRIITKYQIDCIIDVGANIGQYRNFLRSDVEYRDLIISFEPDPSNVLSLKDACKFDKKWIIQDYALGKKNSGLCLNIMKNSVFNSFLEPDNSFTKQYEEDNSIIDKIHVCVKRLDEVLPELSEHYSFRNVFLKLDTQGFDLDIFEGCLGCIDMIYGVQTEASVTPIYKNMPLLSDSLKLFKSRGFDVSGLYPIDDRFPHAHEFNCIYLPCSSAIQS